MLTAFAKIKEEHQVIGEDDNSIKGRLAQFQDQWINEKNNNQDEQFDEGFEYQSETTLNQRVKNESKGSDSEYKNQKMQISSSVAQSLNEIPVLDEDQSSSTFYDFQDYLQSICPDEEIASDLQRFGLKSKEKVLKKFESRKNILNQLEI